MMIFSKRTKFPAALASTVICSLLLVAGCAPVGEKKVKPEVELEKQMPKAAAAETVTLALKFTPQDSTTYKVITESQKSVKWEGPLPDNSTFKGGQNRDRIEMTFTQQIQSVDDKGNAIAKITVKELKYSSTIRDNPVLDFDSSRPKDPNHPLAKLIGQSYTIKITPTGEVAEVVDTKQAEAAVRRGSSVPRRALRLLGSDAIKRRHGILALPDTDKNQLRPGDNWSSIKAFTFGLMGPKSYEKIYTLKEIKDANSQQIAIVEMNAIPTSEMAEQLHKKQTTNNLSKMFDNTETYTGRLEFDLTAGKIEKCLEKLESEWVVVDPSAEQEADTEPAVLRMSAIRLYSLERID